VVAVGGVRLLAEPAERRFAFALDLVEALTDEGKVIGYSCYHWEPLKFSTAAKPQAWSRCEQLGRREGTPAASELILHAAIGWVLSEHALGKRACQVNLHRHLKGLTLPKFRVLFARDSPNADDPSISIYGALKNQIRC
jgi:hypothetical protein